MKTQHPLDTEGADLWFTIGLTLEIKRENIEKSLLNQTDPASIKKVSADLKSAEMKCLTHWKKARTS